MILQRAKWVYVMQNQLHCQEHFARHHAPLTTSVEGFEDLSHVEQPRQRTSYKTPVHWRGHLICLVPKLEY
ncbi:hypothetical protein ATCV1_z538L [Acanthocystis turfacea chlorella virus 1]|uniref:Uncharacterized protein z538L n=1 Tax=Chlorovirus heliozoae TaxID=322019 RepID=A7K9E8_9PHYC|nr:hypothetical protein ATCV1_z538L [Acanthocystis turfacea chlorella virus 1]ABT16672.1 hypothetical protein ATCV1_z538L [Acanthocystis turfacea chlorella virus 1]